jgi:hypothetical protein
MCSGSEEGSAHKLVYHSTLGLRVIKKKKKKKKTCSLIRASAPPGTQIPSYEGRCKAT